MSYSHFFYLSPSSLVVDCGPVDLVLGFVVFENSGNSTLFGSRIQYSCKDFPQIKSKFFHNFSHLFDWSRIENLTLRILSSVLQTLTSVMKADCG